MPNIWLQNGKEGGTWHALSPGESGHDQISTEDCPECGAAAGSYGVCRSYTWDDEAHAWSVTGMCGSCGYDMPATSIPA